MEDQGIMALPQGQAMQGPTAQPAAQQMDPAAMAAFEQARMQINPKEFGDTLLSEASKADPETVKQFMSMLQNTNLPPEILDALGKMVDIILAEPQNYPQIRKELIDAGVPEDILPPEFDAAYFAAMNMALDQLSANMAPAAQNFAGGGIASLTPIASSLAKMGRGSDTMLAHITPSEARLLRRNGGSGTINPDTGLREFGWLSSAAKSIGGAFKSVGNAITGAVKGIANGIKSFANSTVGRIVTTVALGFFLGPAAAGLLGVTSAAGIAAVSGFVGGFGTSLLAGQNLKTALKNGAIGGLVAGAGSAISGGASAFQSSGMPAPTPGEAIFQQWQKFTGGLESLAGKAPVAEAGTGVDTSTMARANVATPGAPVPENAFRPIEYPGANGPMASAADNVQLASSQGPTMTDTGPNYTLRDTSNLGMNQGLRVPGESLGQGLRATGGESLYQVGRAGTVPGMGEGIMSAAKNIYGGEFGQAASDLGNVFFGTTPRTIGTGLVALSMASKPKQPAPPGIIPKETGYDLLRKNPEIYGVTPGGGYVTYGMPYYVTPPRFATGGIAALAPRRYALGGYASGGSNRFPRRTGQIDGPGTETSDSIPAMLSDGEFVMTARAVRGAGKGSRREGAKRMYAMMKALERKSNG